MEFAKLILAVDSTTAKSSKTDLDNLTESGKKAEGQFRSLDKAAIAMGAAIGAAAVASAALVKAQIDAADAASDASQAAGTSVEKYTQLAYAMKFGAQGAASLDDSLKFLNKNVIDAVQGNEKAQASFAMLGIAYKNTDGTLRDSADVMLDVAEKFAGMEDGAAKSSLAMDLFGKSGAEIVPFLNQGRDGIKALTDEADRYGVTLSGNVADAAGQFNDNIVRGQSVVQGFGNQIMKAMLPAMNSLSNEFVATASNGDTLESAASGVVAILKGVVSVGVTTSATLHAIGNALGGVAAATAAALSGDFAAARDIMGTVFDDTVNIASNTMTRLDAIWTASADTVVAQEQRKREAITATHFAVQNQPVGGAPTTTPGAAATAPSRTVQQQPTDNFDYGAAALNFNSLDAIAAEEEASAAAYTAARMERLNTQFMTEREAEMLRYTQQQEDFKLYAEQKLLTQDEINRRELEMKKQHDANMLAAGEMTNKAMLVSALGSAETIFGAFSARSKTMFKLQKAAGIAQGLVSIQTGIANAMSLPWPLNLAAAANVAVTGAGIMSKLKSMTDSGGGSVGIASGGGSISAGSGDMPSSSGIIQQAAPRQQTTDIRLTGIRPDDMISGSYLQKIIEGIGETLADNGGRMGKVELVTA